MFNAEESLKHLKAMRLSVIMMKDGQTVEGIPALELEEEKKDERLIIKNQQK